MDDGNVRVFRSYRSQHKAPHGPYKGTDGSMRKAAFDGAMSRVAETIKIRGYVG
ncbi:MAG: hypothetical protein HN798_10725 [Chloroflexi bacterium]|nr:hypothetical protein [Chloroflexota bacterium]